MRIQVYVCDRMHAVTSAVVGTHTHAHTHTHTHIYTHIHRVVTIFEVGKLTDESLGSFLTELDKVRECYSNELSVAYHIKLKRWNVLPTCIV